MECFVLCGYSGRCGDESDAENTPGKEGYADNDNGTDQKKVLRGGEQT